MAHSLSRRAMLSEGQGFTYTVRRASVSTGKLNRPATHIALSQQNDGDQTEVDWDAAWARMQKQMRSQVETKTESRAPPPRQATQVPLSPMQQKLRAQERLLLDLWTTEDFFKFGAVGAVVSLLVFALFIGPPPSDGRCTLPWC